MKKLMIALCAVAALSSCGNRQTGDGKQSSDAKAQIKIDGSSTVYPISEAVAEDYKKTNANVDITVGLSGTGGGFKKFGRGETDISDASRAITTGEDSICKAASVDYIELPVAYDGIAIVVNAQNTWLKSITVTELKKMWQPDAQDKVKKWSDINPKWPDEEIHLFGTGTASGTFDYFTEAINGKAKAIRGDYNPSANPNVLVEGISADKDALGFFGLAYYESNKDKLKIIPVDNEKGNGAIAPSQQTVKDGSYQPLSRPLFIYIAKKSVSLPEVRSFVDFYLANAGKLSTEVGYIALPDAVYGLVKKRWAAGTTGSVLTGKDAVGVKLEDLLSAETAAK